LFQEDLEVSTIYASRHFAEKGTGVVYDVNACIRSWGTRGILSGALFGFAFGALLVAISPLTTSVLTFGTIGTLIVGAVECAVIAGGFGMFAAALYGQGVSHDDATGFEPALVAGRLLGDVNWQEEGTPLSAWPDRWAYPGSSVADPSLMTLPPGALTPVDA
jgi:hypothetical protein